MAGAARFLTPAIARRARPAIRMTRVVVMAPARPRILWWRLARRLGRMLLEGVVLVLFLTALVVFGLACRG